MQEDQDTINALKNQIDDNLQHSHNQVFVTQHTPEVPVPCCDNGDIEETHDCQKQPPLQDENTAKTNGNCSDAQSEVEEMVEHCASVCDSVEFLRGVPVELPRDTKALLRGRVRKALTNLATTEYERGKADEARRRDGIEKAIEQSIIDQHIQLERARIVEEYGDYNDGCGCCSYSDLKKDLEEELTK
jgi:hypothetical protein